MMLLSCRVCPSIQWLRGNGLGISSAIEKRYPPWRICARVLLYFKHAAK